MLPICSDVTRGRRHEARNFRLIKMIINVLCFNSNLLMGFIFDIFIVMSCTLTLPSLRFLLLSRRCDIENESSLLCLLQCWSYMPKIDYICKFVESTHVQSYTHSPPLGYTLVSAWETTTTIMESRVLRKRLSVRNVTLAGSDKALAVVRVLHYF